MASRSFADHFGFSNSPLDYLLDPGKNALNTVRDVFTRAKSQMSDLVENGLNKTELLLEKPMNAVLSSVDYVTGLWGASLSERHTYDILRSDENFMNQQMSLAAQNLLNGIKACPVQPIEHTVEPEARSTRVKLNPTHIDDYDLLSPSWGRPLEIISRNPKHFAGLGAEPSDYVPPLRTDKPFSDIRSISTPAAGEEQIGIIEGKQVVYQVLEVDPDTLLPSPVFESTSFQDGTIVIDEVYHDASISIPDSLIARAPLGGKILLEHKLDLSSSVYVVDDNSRLGEVPINTALTLRELLEEVNGYKMAPPQANTLVAETSEPLQSLVDTLANLARAKQPVVETLSAPTAPAPSIADVYQSHGGSHYKRVQAVLSENFDGVSTYTDVMKALNDSRKQGSDVTIRRWDSSAVNNDKVIHYINKNHGTMSNRKLLEGVEQMTGHSMSLSTMYKYLHPQETRRVERYVSVMRRIGASDETIISNIQERFDLSLDTNMLNQYQTTFHKRKNLKLKPQPLTASAYTPDYTLPKAM